MKKVSTSDQMRIKTLFDDIEAQKVKIEAKQVEINALLEDFSEMLNEVEGVLDDIASEIEQYVDGRSEKWVEENGSAYENWVEGIRLTFERPENVELDFSIYLDPLGNIDYEVGEC